MKATAEVKAYLGFTQFIGFTGFSFVSPRGAFLHGLLSTSVFQALSRATCYFSSIYKKVSRQYASWLALFRIELTNKHLNHVNFTPMHGGSTQKPQKMRLVQMCFWRHIHYPSAFYCYYSACSVPLVTSGAGALLPTKNAGNTTAQQSSQIACRLTSLQCGSNDFSRCPTILVYLRNFKFLVF